MRFLENVDLNVPFCEEAGCWVCFVEYALWCNELYIRLIKSERTEEKNLIYNSYAAKKCLAKQILTNMILKIISYLIKYILKQKCEFAVNIK